MIVRAVCLAVLVCAAPAIAQQAALVEDAKGKNLDVDFMDYVDAGRVIKLAPGDELVLGYLRSCWPETIKGGTVTVGAEQSTVAGGTVRREKVECDGGKMRLTQAQSGQAGVMVFRAPPRPAQAAAAPQATLYGLSPVLDVKGGGTVTIERIDQPGEKLTVQVAAQQLQRGAFHDLAKAGQTLVAGGVYRASAGPGREIVFKVDPEAKPGQAPVISRLLRL
ncbi:MAG: hypothetical protein IBJ15_02900 [Alphaproteobacteria bacterium]|nr:hypothetical protein [Alphaproteobacteria bacterium]